MSQTVKCANCGDSFKMTPNAVSERAKRGWCSGCFRQWEKSRRVSEKHGEYWVDRGTPRLKHGSGGFASRPDYDAP